MRTREAPASPYVRGSDGELLLEAGQLTEHGEKLYTEGDCWALAWHFAHLLGTPESLYTMGEVHRWQHVVLQVDDDLYLDATGLWTEAQLDQVWHTKLTPLPYGATRSLEAYTDYLDQKSFVFGHAGGHCEARRVAEAMLRLPELAFLAEEPRCLELVG